MTVEDHWPEGGLGDAVLAALADADERAAGREARGREMPRSGKPAELLAAYGIDADAIARAARELVGAVLARHRLVELTLPLDGPRGTRLHARAAARRRAPTGASRGRRRPNRSSSRTAAPRSDASLTRESLTGRASASAMICTQSRSSQQRPAGRDHLLDLRHQVEHLGEPERDALERRLAEVERGRVERQAADRPGCVRVPARAALAAEQRQEREAVRVGIAAGERPGRLLQGLLSQR